MGRTTRAARGLGGIFFIVALIGALIFAFLFVLDLAIPPFVDLIVGILTGLLQSISSGITQIFFVIGDIIISIILLPPEILFNLLIKATNVIPFVSLDYVDLTGNGLCTGSEYTGEGCTGDL